MPYPVWAQRDPPSRGVLVFSPPSGEAKLSYKRGFRGDQPLFGGQNQRVLALTVQVCNKSGSCTFLFRNEYQMAGLSHVYDDFFLPMNMLISEYRLCNFLLNHPAPNKKHGISSELTSLLLLLWGMAMETAVAPSKTQQVDPPTIAYRPFCSYNWRGRDGDRQMNPETLDQRPGQLMEVVRRALLRPYTWTKQLVKG